MWTTKPTEPFRATAPTASPFDTPLRCEITHVHAHTAEPGGRDLVAEAAGQLRDERAAECDGREHRTRERERGADEGGGGGDDREHEPHRVGVLERVHGLPNSPICGSSR